MPVAHRRRHWQLCRLCSTPVEIAAEGAAEEQTEGLAAPEGGTEGMVAMVAVWAAVVGATGSQSIRSACKTRKRPWPQSTTPGGAQAEARVALRRVTQATPPRQATR